MPSAAPRVVHITTVHKPNDVRIFHKQCVSLARAGYDVHLLQRDHPGGEERGVKIVPLRSHGSRLARMSVGVWQAFRAARRLKPDLVHFHDAELIWAGLLFKLSGTKVVYDVHEAVAKDLHDKAYLPRWAIGPLGAAVRLVETVAERSFDRLICATSAIRQQFGSARAVLVRNTPILGELSAAEARPFRERPRQIVYLGGLAAFNGVEQMVRALDHVGGEAPFRLVLGGGFGDPADEARIRALPGWRFVDYLGWVPRERIAEIFGQSRAGLVVYQPTPNVTASEPNKFFELLSAGLPLVASNFPVWRAFIDEVGCGTAVDPTDPVAIGRAIRFMLDHPDEAEAMGARGRDAVFGGYNWSVDAEVLLDQYRALVGPPCR